MPGGRALSDSVEVSVLVSDVGEIFSGCQCAVLRPWSHARQCRPDQISTDIPAGQLWCSLIYVALVTVVDHGSPVPAYEQLSAILRDRIIAGEWTHGPLPSVKQLQDTYDVGRDTVLRALDVLRRDGLIITVPRRGSYIAPNVK
jgi:DNA-binding transcriptional ArsR family regulator